MPIHDVAFDHEVSSPQCVEDLLAAEHAARVRREQVQQCLLERGEVQLVLAGEHLTVENIDLEVSDAQAWHELADLTVSSAQHRPGAGDEIIWNERNADVVVSAALEGIELPP